MPALPPHRGDRSSLLLAALGAPLVAPAAGPQDRAELSQVQRKLERVRKVLENAKADASEIAAALEQADRDVAAAQVALAEAERRFRAAQARKKRPWRPPGPSWRSRPSRR